MSESIAAKKLFSGIIFVVILSVCLCITTSALVFSMITVENNIFKTGSIKINLNDEKPIITESEFLFEPGMKVQKEFFIENNSTIGVYYRIYFDNVMGGLADVLQITIADGDEVLYQGTATNLTKENVKVASKELLSQEKRTLTISFTFPANEGNSAKNTNLTFDVYADAVQSKNNPDRLFD